MTTTRKIYAGPRLNHFFESLDELFDSIESNSTQAAQPKSPPPPAKSSSQSSSLPKKTRPAKINLSEFEDCDRRFGTVYPEQTPETP